MHESNSPEPEFGSELRRRETPGHRRLRRRNGIAAALLGILAVGSRQSVNNVSQPGEKP